MPNKKIYIRTMKKNEVALAIEWAKQEGWNPGLEDINSYYEADPNGFFIGLLNDDPIAVISAIKYSDAFGFIGLYIVKPIYRAKGFGMQIWNTALKYLEGCNIGLDGVIDQQNNYKKSGFHLYYRNIRYAGISTKKTISNINISNLNTMPFEIIDMYLNSYFPTTRSAFNKAWHTQKGAVVQGIIEDGELKAYGVIRPCQEGYKIGPLYATDLHLAKELFYALSSSVTSSEPIFLDVPEVNKDALKLVETLGMNMTFETAKMYTKNEPKIQMEHIFGVTSFEIG